ncbi:MAG TPA: AraC family transcriptional regulator [Phenylobacterium sp.]|nr:AraC family transcriptional regulator [Phenylobacterium sp.]
MTGTTLRPQTAGLDAATRYIEANLMADLSVAELARVAGLSEFHFTRQFSARFGQSAIAFVRARRMQVAARALAMGDDRSLVELAFDLGFDSQEGFTRAFKRAFGVSPGRFRKGAAPLGSLEISMTATAVFQDNLTANPTPVRNGPLRLAGKVGYFPEEQKFMIPTLWNELFQSGEVKPGRVTYGACWGAGQERGMGYLAGVALADGEPVPEGLTLMEVAARTYLTFRLELSDGDIHPQILGASKAIWGELLPASGCSLANAPDLEFYPADFAPKAGKWIEYWVPVEA